MHKPQPHNPTAIPSSPLSTFPSGWQERHALDGGIPTTGTQCPLWTAFLFGPLWEIANKRWSFRRSALEKLAKGGKPHLAKQPKENSTSIVIQKNPSTLKRRSLQESRADSLLSTRPCGLFLSYHFRSTILPAWLSSCQRKKEERNKKTLQTWVNLFFFIYAQIPHQYQSTDLRSIETTKHCSHGFLFSSFSIRESFDMRMSCIGWRKGPPGWLVGGSFSADHGSVLTFKRVATDVV